jgi:alkylation response protein AidB-like acyl-CoA dehydrogenase
MDLTFTVAERAFRDELREWLDHNDPGPEPLRDEDAHFAWRLAWQRRLHDGAWAGVHWPVEYGGRGATVTESAIFFEELGRAHRPLPANALGLLLGGPTLMVWGSDGQRERHLPGILSGDEVWCQGFSEPDAGSDLAALKTRAVRGDGGWVVTGQKVWTSLAQYSKWCMLVARTDGGETRHRGLTYFLLDMEQEGVTVRPLRQITGDSEFNELFLEEAHVPDENVVGGVGNGWKVALTTLMNERAGLAFFLQVTLRGLLDRLIDELRARDRLDDPLVRDRIADLHARTEILRLTAYRGLTTLEKYGQPGPEGSLTKWMWSQTNQQLVQTAVDTLGPYALAEHRCRAGARAAERTLTPCTSTSTSCRPTSRARRATCSHGARRPSACARQPRRTASTPRSGPSWPSSAGRASRSTRRTADRGSGWSSCACCSRSRARRSPRHRCCPRPARHG